MSESIMSRKKTQHRGKKAGLAEQAENSMGNVFEDMEMPDAETRLAKARLAQRISQLIKALKLSQVQAARRLGIDQPKVSALLRGRLKGFSTERLMRFITALDQDVIISIRPPKDSSHHGGQMLVEV
jgi:predicted XRE-type DNA-binding protein